MAHLPPAAIDHLATHHGVASIAQLRELGVSEHTFRDVRRSGQLIEVLHGVYHHPVVPLDEAARCVAVCAAHQEAVISSVTAGRLWGYRRLPRDRRIHGLFPPASQPTIARWVVPYRTAAFRTEDVVTRGDGIRLTSRARTAFDLARALSDIDLLSVMEQAMHDGAFGADTLWDVAAPWLSRQRPWARRFIGLLAQRVDGGAAESHPEVVVGAALVVAGLVGLERQHAIELPGYGRGRFDLAVPSLRWAIEVDKHPTHQETDGRRSDLRRDRAASTVGWRVSRIGPDGLGRHLDATVQALLATYRTLRAAA